jgi:dephospho-CoA kinase
VKDRGVQGPEHPGGLLIGLTGLYCAGKNHVGRLLEVRGIPVLDVDKLGHRVIETEAQIILERFGAGILGGGGKIDRKRLGARVFGKPEEIAALEGIIHPAVNRETDRWIEQTAGKTRVINAALLQRSSAFTKLDCIILVTAPVLIRLLRARKRDKLPWAAIFQRFKSQKEFKAQYFSNKTDIYRVSNNGCSRLFRGSLEKRMELILSRIGIA